MKSTLLLAFTYLMSIFEETNYDKKCFTAAVYELVKPIYKDVEHEIIESLAIYEYVVAKAAENGANIIVFPEHGIFVPPNERDAVKPYLEKIPPKMNAFTPCDLPYAFKRSRILYTLSCLAKRNKIYIVTNMGEIQYCDHNTDPRCPFDGRYQFNTAVAFDSTGKLVAKYRKFHLYKEYCYDYPEKQEFVAFDTPFGRFGLFTCFDLLFKDPAIGLVEKYNVTTLVLITWWFNEMPFLNAHILQQSWAISQNVNLLSANANDPLLNSSGSGIYNSKNGAVIYTHDSPEKTAHLLIADLSVNPSDKYSDCGCIKKSLALKFDYDLDLNVYEEIQDLYRVEPLDFTLFNYVNLSDVEHFANQGYDNVCCSLEYKFTRKLAEFKRDYVFMVGSRMRNDSALWCEEFCAVAAFDWSTKQYSTDFGDSFDFIRLKTKFTTQYVFPSLITNGLELVPISEWTYSRNKNIAEIKTKSALPIISAALYARCYDKDPPFPSF